MPAQRSLPMLLAASLVSLAGCASAPEGEYPSLALRDAERVSGTLAPPAAPRFVPAPATPATLERLEAIAAEVRAAHARFLEAAPATRGTVAAAAGSAVGSEAWARAQVALAGLQAIRSRALIALADLDRIYVEAATGGGALERIAPAREAAAALVAEEDALIAALAGSLP